MKALGPVLLLCGLIAGAAQTSAAVINLEPPVGSGGNYYIGDTYSQDRFTFKNTNGPNNVSAYDASTVYFS